MNGYISSLFLDLLARITLNLGISFSKIVASDYALWIYTEIFLLCFSANSMVFSRPSAFNCCLIKHY